VKIMRTALGSFIAAFFLSAALALAALAGVNQKFVGAWVMPHPDATGSKNWYWFVKEDGSYETFINNPEGTPKEVGQFSTMGPTFNLHALNGRADFGKYSWLDTGCLLLFEPWKPFESRHSQRILSCRL
jgi:hypothetical protein